MSDNDVKGLLAFSNDLYFYRHEPDSEVIYYSVNTKTGIATRVSALPADVTEDNIHGEIDTGIAVGEEIR